jgi:hypothetical protein
MNPIERRKTMVSSFLLMSWYGAMRFITRSDFFRR